MNKFSTETKLIKESERILKRVQDGESKLNMIEAQGSSLLLNLINGDGEGGDTENREDLLDCSQLIISSYNEISSLNSKYSLDSNDDIKKWFKIEDIDLLKYVPDCIKEIKDKNGQVFPSILKDLKACYAPFKFWEKPIRIEEGGEEKKGEYTKRGEYLKKSKEFSWVFMDFPENKEKLKIIKEVQEKIKEIQEKIKETEKKIKAKNEELIAAQNEPDDEKPSWFSFWHGTHKWNKIKNLRNEIASLESSINGYNEKIKEGEKEIKFERDTMKKENMETYYDDDYVLQRTVAELKQEKKQVMIGMHAEKKGWFKKEQVGDYDTIVTNVEENPRESKQNPYLPSVESFSNSVKNRGYYSNGCLLKDIETLNVLFGFKKNGIKYGIYNDYYMNENTSKFHYSYNDLRKGQYAYYYDENMTLDYAHKMSYRFPPYFFFGFLGYYILARNEIRLVPSDPTIKETYKSRYNAADPITKLLVYDEKDFEFFYKDHKWKLEVYTILEDSNLPEEYWNDKFYPTDKFSDEAFRNITDSYKGNIIDDLKRSKDIFMSSPEMNRCNDYDPFVKYDEFINRLSGYNINNMSESYSLCSYCKETIASWTKNRVKVLISTVSDESNIKKFLNVFFKRMRKNTGSLMLWYQSLTNFDDVYIDTMLSTNILKDDIKDLLVTTGIDQYNKELFNNFKNPNFIDIKNVSDIYEGKDFKVNDNIYIIKNLKIQKNRIVKKEIKEIQDPSTNDETKKIKITRLHLYNNLLDWCKVNDPTKITICKIL